MSAEERPVDWIDGARSVGLGPAGLRGYIAATTVDPNGDMHLVLVDVAAIDQRTYRPTCPEAPHEQLGPLPLDVVKRVAIAQRNHQSNNEGTQQ